MRYVGCSIKRIISVLIRPGAMVRIHHGPPQCIVVRTGVSSTISPLGGNGLVWVGSGLSPVIPNSSTRLLIRDFLPT